MKKKYVNPTLEVFDYIPEGQILSPSKFSVDMGGGSDGSSGTVGDKDNDGFVDGMTNKRNPWGTSPWE